MKAAFRDAAPLVEQRTAADRCGARTAAAPARSLPLLQPRLHRHRRRDRADHGSSLRIGAHPARPRPARGRLRRLRPAARPLGSRWTDAGARPARARRPRAAVRPPTRNAVESDNPRDHVSGGTAAHHARGLGDVPAGLPRRSARLPATGDGRAICSRPLPDGATGTRSAGHGSTVSTTPPWASRDRIPTGSRPPSSTGSASGPRWSCATKGARGSFGRRPSSPHGSSRRARRAGPAGRYSRIPPACVRRASTSGPCSASRRSASAAASAWSSGPQGRLSCRHCSR